MTTNMGNSSVRSSAVEDVVRAKLSRDRLTLAYVTSGAVVSLTAMAYCGLFTPAHYSGALGRFAEIAAEALPPDFSRWQNWTWPLLETLAMSVASTAIGAVLALALSVLVARNLTPLRPLSALLRGGFNFLRSIPELVLGIVLVASFGFGVMAGVFALTLHSIGMLGKFFAELIEHVEPGPVEALRSQGASRPQTFCFAVLPQILPRVVDLTLYRWEHNLRASTVMGLVGAGGIGFELIATLKLFEYREALALLVLILLLVTAIDFIGGLVRLRWLGT